MKEHHTIHMTVLLLTNVLKEIRECDMHQIKIFTEHKVITSQMVNRLLDSLSNAYHFQIFLIARYGELKPQTTLVLYQIQQLCTINVSN